MDRLSILLSMLTGAAITGVLTIAAFSLGFYSWTAVLSAAALGFLLAWPAAYVISRRIKSADPHWQPPHEPKRDAALPRADAREV